MAAAERAVGTFPPSRITLVTGGSRSGKSRYALELAQAYERRVFVATAEVVDAEMQERVDRHRRERGASFRTLEEPLDLAAALHRVPPDSQVVVLDCLTVWLGNLLHHRGPECESYPELEAFLEALQSPPCALVVVTNEVGMGIIPENPLVRRFRDLAGWLNQRVARVADRVVWVVAGLPLTLKP